MSFAAFKEGCIDLVTHLKMEPQVEKLKSMEPQDIFNHFLELKPFFPAIQTKNSDWVSQGPEWIREFAGTQLDDSSWAMVHQLMVITNLLGMLPEGMRQQVDQMSQMLFENIKSNPNISENMAADQDPQQAAEMMKNLTDVMGTMMGGGNQNPANMMNGLTNMMGTLMGGNRGGNDNPANLLLNMLGEDTGSTVSNRRSRRSASRQSARANREFRPRRSRRVPNKPPVANPPNSPNTNP